MTSAEIIDFIRTCEAYEEGNEGLFHRLCVSYKIDTSLGRSTILNMFQLILDERHTADEVRRRFDECIRVLEFLYKHPYRWNDHGVVQMSSTLFGPITSITQEMFVEMEKRYPDYRAHIQDIIDNGPPLFPADY
jgi:hypothetical protein